MAKKNKKGAARDEQRAASEYYRLHTKAVNDLVSATPENSPKVSEAELRKYRSGPKVTLADWAKAVLIKWWFAGSTCFFFLWGLGFYIRDQLDQMVVLGLALGFVTDLLTNNVFRFLAKRTHDNDRWMMLPEKKYITLPLNILYAFLLLLCVVTTYNAINALIISVTGATDTIPLGVEPILFGVFTTLWDLLFLGVKRLMQSMMRDAKESAARGTGGNRHV